MDKKLKKIEVLGFWIVMVIFSIILYKYVVENINLIKNNDIKYTRKNSEIIIENGIELNKEYNINKKNPEIMNLAFSWVLYNWSWNWLWSWFKDFEIFNYDWNIWIRNLNKSNNWYINFDWIENYYPLGWVVKLDTLYNYDENTDSYSKIYEQEDYLPIYWYHNIIEDNKNIVYESLEVKKSKFEEQIKYLTNNLGCRWFTFWYLLEEYILKNKKIPKNACSINFDDGRKNNYTIAYPIFKKYWVVWTFYIIVDLLWKGDYMTREEVNTLYRNWNEIWSHTLFGWSLTNPVWFTLKTKREATKEDIYEQIKKSKDKLEERWFITKTFAYPLWQRNKQIVDMVKESWYIWSRDISKFDVWKEKRTETVSYKDDIIWHMHYIKPEKLSLDEFKKYTSYNTWWQFEDWYKIINSSGSWSVRELTSYKSTKNSYWVISLWLTNDEISKKFIVSNTWSYVINIYWSTWYNEEYDMFKNIETKVDWNLYEKHRNQDWGCIKSSERYFCNYQLILDLKPGIHILNIRNKSEQNRSTIYVDKFNIYRKIKNKNNYILNFYYK